MATTSSLFGKQHEAVKRTLTWFGLSAGFSSDSASKNCVIKQNFTEVSLPGQSLGIMKNIDAISDIIFPLYCKGEGSTVKVCKFVEASGDLKIQQVYESATEV